MMLRQQLLTLRAVSMKHHALCCTQSDEFHGFCNSSGQAYYAVVFFRVMCSYGVSVSLWEDRYQLTPIKTFSTAHSEVLPCILLSKLVRTQPIFQRRINVVLTLRINILWTLWMKFVNSPLKTKPNPTLHFQGCTTLIQRWCTTLK